MSVFDKQPGQKPLARTPLASRGSLENPATLVVRFQHAPWFGMVLRGKPQSPVQQFGVRIHPVLDQYPDKVSLFSPYVSLLGDLKHHLCGP